MVQGCTCVPDPFFRKVITNYIGVNSSYSEPENLNLNIKKWQFTIYKNITDIISIYLVLYIKLSSYSFLQYIFTCFCTVLFVCQIPLFFLGDSLEPLLKGHHWGRNYSASEDSTMYVYYLSLFKCSE